MKIIQRRLLLKINKDKYIVKDEKNKNDIFLPPVLDERAKNYRFIASLDNEIKTMQEAINSLKIKNFEIPIFYRLKTSKNYPLHMILQV